MSPTPPDVSPRTPPKPPRARKNGPRLTVNPGAFADACPGCDVADDACEQHAQADEEGASSLAGVDEAGATRGRGSKRLQSDPVTIETRTYTTPSSPFSKNGIRAMRMTTEAKIEREEGKKSKGDSADPINFDEQFAVFSADPTRNPEFRYMVPVERLAKILATDAMHTIRHDLLEDAKRVLVPHHSLPHAAWAVGLTWVASP
jgi:hypothetical protein